MPRHQPDKPPVITVDIDTFSAALDVSGVAEEEKRAVIEDVWGILYELIAAGFILKPQAKPAHPALLCLFNTAATRYSKKGVIS